MYVLNKAYFSDDKYLPVSATTITQLCGEPMSLLTKDAENRIRLHIVRRSRKEQRQQRRATKKRISKANKAAEEKIILIFLTNLYLTTHNQSI